MRLASIHLAQVKPGVVGKCQVLSIAGKGGGPNWVFAGIGCKAAFGDGRSRGQWRPRLPHKQPNPESGEYQCSRSGGDPPPANRMQRRSRGLSIDHSCWSMYWREKPVAAAGDGLNITRILGAVPQGVPEPADGGVETMIEVDESVGGPQPALQFMPADHLSRPREQQSENLEGLFLQFYPGAVSAEFSGLLIDLEDPKLDHSAAIAAHYPHPSLTACAKLSRNAHCCRCHRRR